MPTWKEPRPHIIIVPEDCAQIIVNCKKFEDAIVWRLTDMSDEPQHAVTMINLN